MLKATPVTGLSHREEDNSVVAEESFSKSVPLWSFSRYGKTHTFAAFVLYYAGLNYTPCSLEERKLDMRFFSF